ncbi:MAG: alanine:cation symporter family protein [Alphaproteobacteria bacterium]|nr:alanine:cation symporter family protein [Alphaproteobacteria bacterium]
MDFNLISTFNEFLWLSFLPIVAFLVAISLPLRLGAGFIVQWQLLKSATRKLFSVQKETFGLGITPRSGFLMSIATSMTAGHLLGTVLVIAIAGYGVLFYVWIFTILLLGVKYIETIQSILFRKVNHRGQFVGGPMYVLKYGLGKNAALLGTILAIFYCIFLLIGSVGLGNHLPVRFIGQLGHEYFDLDPFYIMVGIITIVGICSCYGVRLTSIIVSILMGASLLMFAVMLVYVLSFYGYQLPDFFMLIINEAFSARSADTGASISMMVIFGFARALYGTGTGLGTSGIAHSATVTYDARQQGYMAVIANLIAGILVTFLVSFVIYLSGALDADGESILQLVQFFEHVESYGREAIVITILLMSLASILAWGYYVETVCFFLFGQIAVWPARIFWVGLIPLASLTLSIYFIRIHELALALMAIPNFIAIITVLANVREVEHLNAQSGHISIWRRIIYRLRTLRRIWI